MSLSEITSQTTELINPPTAGPVGLIEALEEAIKALNKEADLYAIAAKMVAGMAEVAPPQAHQDARRRAKLLGAVETLELHLRGMRPY